MKKLMVKSLISLLSARQTTILSGATILMVTVLASKLLGLIKYRMLVTYFNTDDAAVFIGAFGLPEFLFNLLIFATLSVAFIPVYIDCQNKKGDRQSYVFASNLLNLSLLVFAVVSFFAAIFVSQLNSYFFLPGFTGQQKILTDNLTRIILTGQMFLAVGSFFIGIGQSHQRFIITSIAPVFYNLGIILGIIFLSPYFGIAGPAYGVVLGSVMHVLIQLPLIYKLGFRYSFTFNMLNAEVRDVFRLMSVRSIGLAAEAVSDRVSMALASLISYSSVTLLNFSQALQATPVSLFGATIAQAALPVLSKEGSGGDRELFKRTLLTTMHQILFFTLPAAAILIVLRIPVVRLVYGASQFSWLDTVLTGRTVALWSLGLAAQSTALLLIRGFYALKDTKTPVIVSLLTVSVNIACSYFFVRVLSFDVWSLGLAIAISNNLNFLVLLYFLDKKTGGFDEKMLFLPACKMVAASAIAAIALYIPVKALDQLVFDTTKTVNLLMLTSIASAFGLGVYLALVWLMKVKELETFVDIIKRGGKLQRFQQTAAQKEITPQTDSI